jgi:hypothetical protein
MTSGMVRKALHTGWPVKIDVNLCLTLDLFFKQAQAPR